jgi:hypothetical protein
LPGVEAQLVEQLTKDYKIEGSNQASACHQEKIMSIKAFILYRFLEKGKTRFNRSIFNRMALGRKALSRKI